MLQFDLLHLLRTLNEIEILRTDSILYDYTKFPEVDTTVEPRKNQVDNLQKLNIEWVLNNKLKSPSQPQQARGIPTPLSNKRGSHLPAH